MWNFKIKKAIFIKILRIDQVVFITILRVYFRQLLLIMMEQILHYIFVMQIESVKVLS
jgi:hypothetical protein